MAWCPPLLASGPPNLRRGGSVRPRTGQRQQTQVEVNWSIQLWLDLLRVVLGAKLVTQDEVGLPTSGALKAQVRYRDLFPLLYRSPAPLRFVQPRNELVDPTLHRQAADFDLLGT